MSSSQTAQTKVEEMRPDLAGERKGSGRERSAREKKKSRKVKGARGQEVPGNSGKKQEWARNI